MNSSLLAASRLAEVRLKGAAELSRRVTPPPAPIWGRGSPSNPSQKDRWTPQTAGVQLPAGIREMSSVSCVWWLFLGLTAELCLPHPEGCQVRWWS